MLSRKHYNALSKLIADNLIEFNSDKGIIILKDRFKYNLLEYLKIDNRNFDKDRFIEASLLENTIDQETEGNQIKLDPKDLSHISNHVEAVVKQFNLDHCTGAEIGKYGERIS